MKPVVLLRGFSDENPALIDAVNRNLIALGTENGPTPFVRDYTFSSNDQIDSAQVDATSGNRIITLPAPSGVRRRRIVKTDSSGNTVTINPSTVGQLINGLASWVLYTQYDVVELEPTGTGWILVTDSSLSPISNSIRLWDTDHTHYDTISLGSNLTANRTLSLVTGDANRTVTLSGNPTLDDWFNQSVKTTASPTFAALTLTAALTVPNGGTGRATSTTAYGLLAAGTTATGVHQTLATGATTDILVGGGASALPAWTTATGTGAPVRAISPTFTGTILGASLQLSSLTSGRVVFTTTSGLLTDDADMTFATDTLTVTKFSGALNGTVGATTPTTGAFTTLNASNWAQFSGASGAPAAGSGCEIRGGSTPQIIGFNRTGGTYLPMAYDGTQHAFSSSASLIATISSTGLAVTGNVSLTGALQLGNAYVAGALVGTGSIVIKDSTGTSYRVVCLV